MESERPTSMTCQTLTEKKHIETRAKDSFRTDRELSFVLYKEETVELYCNQMTEQRDENNTDQPDRNGCNKTNIKWFPSNAFKDCKVCCQPHPCHRHP